jgi:hypothetical protein
MELCYDRVCLVPERPDCYLFPLQDTTVLMSLWSVHYDNKHWKDPEQFRPERHLNGKGELVTDEWLLPFGLGKRTRPHKPLYTKNRSDTARHYGKTMRQ